MSLVTAKTEYLDAGGTRFAYRRLGQGKGLPLVCLQHFSGTMDSWDPAVVDRLAEDREVIVFNNKGIGTSSGETPDRVDAMAADAKDFIHALGMPTVDLLGFSLGGMVAQLLAADQPGLVRRLLLAGTAPQGGEQHLMEVLQDAISRKDSPDPRLPLFFTPSSASQAAGRAFLERVYARKHDRDPDSGDLIMHQQATALITWCATQDPRHTLLAKIRQPVLVVSGSHDTMLPYGNAITMFKHIPNAELILYPDSGHGALFQHAQRFVNHASHFLTE